MSLFMINCCLIIPSEIASSNVTSTSGFLLGVADIFIVTVGEIISSLKMDILVSLESPICDSSTIKHIFKSLFLVSSIKSMKFLPS